MFVKRTSKYCSLTKNGKDYISGLYKTKVYRRSCETECKTYSWCRGIAFGNNRRTTGRCKLLTRIQRRRPMLHGWRKSNSGNWAEPGHWKNGKSKSWRCYEKVFYGEATLGGNTIHFYAINTVSKSQKYRCSENKCFVLCL